MSCRTWRPIRRLLQILPFATFFRITRHLREEDTRVEDGQHDGSEKDHPVRECLVYVFYRKMKVLRSIQDEECHFVLH